MTVYETECDGATFGRSIAPAVTSPESSIGARGRQWIKRRVTAERRLVRRTRAILERAGFTSISIESLIRPMRIGADIEDALGFIRSMPRVADLLAAVPTDKQDAAVDAVREALEPYANADGVVMHNNGEWLVTARR